MIFDFHFYDIVVLHLVCASATPAHNHADKKQLMECEIKAKSSLIRFLQENFKTIKWDKIRWEWIEED